jgi:hypothetical protein
MAQALKLNWLTIAMEFVRLRPKTSAAIAFEVGLLAAQAVNRMTNNPRAAGHSRFINMAPSLADFGDYLPGRKAAPPKRRRKPAAAAKRAPRIKGDTNK